MRTQFNPFSEAANALLKSSDSCGFREVSLQSGYDPFALPITEHPLAVKAMRTILGGAYDHLPDQELPGIYCHESDQWRIAEGPALYALVTSHRKYYIRQADHSALVDPKRRGVSFLFDSPGTISVDIGVGDGLKRAMRIRLTARARQIALAQNRRLARRSHSTAAAKHSESYHSIPEVPKVIVMVDISDRSLKQAIKTVTHELKHLNLTYNILWSDFFNPQSLSQPRTEKVPDVTLIALHEDFMGKDWFARSGRLQQMVRATINQREMIDWNWKFEMFGGTFNNLKIADVKRFIGDMSDLFEPPHGEEQQRGGDRFIVGLDFGTDPLTSNSCYDTAPFKIWAAMAFYRAAMRAGFQPFDLSAFQCKIVNTSCIHEVKNAFPELSWGPIKQRELHARAIQAEFRADSDQVLIPHRYIQREPLLLRGVRLEPITRYSPKLWSWIFGLHDMRIGSLVPADTKRFETSKIKPHYAVAEYTKRVGFHGRDSMLRPLGPSA